MNKLPQESQLFSDHAEIPSLLTKYDDELNAIADIVHGLPGSSDTDTHMNLYTRANVLADQVSASLGSLPLDVRDKTLIELTNRLAGIFPYIPSRSLSTDRKAANTAMAAETIVERYGELLDPMTIPIDALLKLTRLSMHSGSSATTNLAEAVYRRCHNDLFSQNAPDFTRDPSFTSLLLQRYLSREEEVDPASLMIYGGKDVARLTELHLMAYGFSGREAARTILSWGTLQSSEGVDADFLRDELYSNINMIGRVETLRPGLSARLFRERGVAHFGRYTEELLLQQFEPLPFGAQPEFMLLAHADHNAAFSHTAHTLIDSLGPDGVKGLRIGEVSSPQDLLRLAMLLSDQFGPAQSIVIGGHATSEEIDFGRDAYIRDEVDIKLVIDRVSEQLDGLEQCILPDGIIVLVSCSAGADNGIGEAIADFLNRHTQAPSTPGNIIRVARSKSGHLVAEFGEDVGRSIVPKERLAA